MTIRWRVTLALVLACAGAAPALAQQPPPPAKPPKPGPVFGVEAGFSMSRISPDVPGEALSRGPGLLAGGYVQMPLFSTIGLQVEVVYAQKTTHLTSSSDLKLEYLEVPILAKLKLIKKFYLTEGIALGFPVRARRSTASGTEQDVKAEVTNPDLGLVIGGGLPLSKRLAAEFRYEGGFKKVFNTPNATQLNRSFTGLARIQF